ncbi:MAG: hypothetical protein ABL921_21925 [Pirellula sp.]
MLVNRANALLLVVMIVMPKAWTIGQETKEKTPAQIYLDSSREPFAYVCAMFGECTKIYHLDANKSNFQESWFLHSYSPKLKVHRHDQVDQSITTSEGFSPLSMSGEMTLFQRNEKEYKQFWGGRAKKPPENSKADDPQSGVWRQGYFEPLAVPMIGYFCYNQQSLENVNALSNLIGQYRLVEEESLSGLCVQRFSNSRTNPVFDRVTFDERVGGMPIEVCRFEVQKGKDVLQERITTKWVRIGERWLPSSTEAEPQLRTSKTQWKVRYHWMLKDIPDRVFDMDSNYSFRAQQLKDLAVEQWNAAISRK